MRIYAVADLHGKTRHLETLSRVSREYKPDAMVVAGDITCYFQWKSTLYRLGQLGKENRLPILCIRGNSDFKQLGPRLIKNRHLTLLGASPHTIQGISFLGANGTVPLPFASRVCLGENQLFKTLLPHMDKKTILVAHPPPRGVCDKVGNRFSAGSQNLLNFIKTTHPAMVLCGHIHEQAGQMAFVNETLVVNCAMNNAHRGAIIDLQQDAPPRVQFLRT
jgi:Icc-related predicted phosphoesterase